MMSHLEFESVGFGKEYKFAAIHDSTVYTKELEKKHLSGLYYLFSWNDYSKNENNQESALVI